MTNLESLDAAIAALNHAWGGLYDAAKLSKDGTPEKAELNDAEDSVWESYQKLERVRKEMAP